MAHKRKTSIEGNIQRETITVGSFTVRDIARQLGVTDAELIDALSTLSEDNSILRRSITAGLSYTVREAGMREAVRRVKMAENVKDYLKAFPDDEELATALSIYPHVAGSVLPLISIDEFLEMREVEIDELSKAAMELNPHWFVIPGSEKKTDEQPIPSTENLPNL